MALLCSCGAKTQNCESFWNDLEGVSSSVHPYALSHCSLAIFPPVLRLYGSHCYCWESQSSTVIFIMNCNQTLALPAAKQLLKSSSQSSWGRGSCLLSDKRNAAGSFCSSGHKHGGFLSSAVYFLLPQSWHGHWNSDVFEGGLPQESK